MDSEDENDICTQDEKKYVNEMVKAVMILDHTKKPFKQSDIFGFLSKKPNRKMCGDLLEKTKQKLKELGLTLLETKSTSSKAFILINRNFPLPGMHEHAAENEVADRTLLILILTFIFMKEGSVSNVDLLNHLEQLNIYNEQQSVHPYFGDIKKKIFTEYTSQLYLEKVVDKESETFEVKWGERAHAEVTKRSILEFVCKIGYEGSIQPKNLTSHYHKVLEEEKSKDGEITGDEPMAVDD